MLLLNGQRAFPREDRARVKANHGRVKDPRLCDSTRLRTRSVECQVKAGHDIFELTRSRALWQATRHAASAFFFELLVLSTRECVKIEQPEAYGAIEVQAKDRLWELNVGAQAVAVDA